MMLISARFGKHAEGNSHSRGTTWQFILLGDSLDGSKRWRLEKPSVRANIRSLGINRTSRMSRRDYTERCPSIIHTLALVSRLNSDDRAINALSLVATLNEIEHLRRGCKDTELASYGNCQLPIRVVVVSRWRFLPESPRFGSCASSN